MYCFETITLLFSSGDYIFSTLIAPSLVIFVFFPFDVDFIPVVGCIDDAIVAYVCIRKWRAENAANDAVPADRVIDVDSTGA